MHCFDGQWFIEEIEVSRFIHEEGLQEYVEVESKPYEYWQSSLTPTVLNLELVAPEHLALSSLYTFAQRRDSEGLDANRFYLAFWHKVLQPGVTLVMVLLAASFVFGSTRQMSMGYRIVIGIAAGLGFRYGQEFLGQVSLVFKLDPFIAAASPMFIFFFLALWGIRRAA